MLQGVKSPPHPLLRTFDFDAWFWCTKFHSLHFRVLSSESETFLPNKVRKYDINWGRLAFLGEHSSVPQAHPQLVVTPSGLCQDCDTWSLKSRSSKAMLSFCYPKVSLKFKVPCLSRCIPLSLWLPVLPWTTKKRQNDWVDFFSVRVLYLSSVLVCFLNRIINVIISSSLI